MNYLKLFDNFKVRKILYHSSSPENRISIMKNGLIPSVGDSYSLHWDGDENLKPLVFLSTEPYDSTWDDDIWEVDVEGLTLLPDPDIDQINTRCVDSIIEPYRLKLIYEGSGE
jgi:hypothetical protein